MLSQMLREVLTPQADPGLPGDTNSLSRTHLTPDPLPSSPLPLLSDTQYVTRYHRWGPSRTASWITASDPSYLKLVVGRALRCYLTFSIFTLFSHLEQITFENKDCIFIPSCITYLNQAQSYQRLRIEYKVVQWICRKSSVKSKNILLIETACS